MGYESHTVATVLMHMYAFFVEIYNHNEFHDLKNIASNVWILQYSITLATIHLFFRQKVSTN